MNRLCVIFTACLMIAACKQVPTTPFGEEVKPDAQLECAIGTDGAWSKDCTLERNGDRLTIRHPDGGFRRFRVLSDGRGLEAADGSEQAAIQIVDEGRIEARIGSDRYRLPARMETRAR